MSNGLRYIAIFDIIILGDVCLKIKNLSVVVFVHELQGMG